MGLAASKQEAFWEACGFGRIEQVRKFIAEGIDVNWVSYTHNSCAIHVASQGKVEIVKMLLSENCNVNARDDRGNTALHHAAMKGHTEIINLLVDAGVEINAQDKNNWTALICAAYWCHPEAVKLLIRRSCNVHLENKEQRSALHEACRSKETNEQGLADIVQLLVDAKCDIDSKSSDVGEADFTPLMFCAYHGHANAAQVLIDAGCDINAQGSNGWSALHWAAARGQVEVTQVLLEGGICPVLLAEREELAIDRATDPDIKEMIAEAIEYYKRSQVVETDDELDATDSESDDIDNLETSADKLHTAAEKQDESEKGSMEIQQTKDGEICDSKPEETAEDPDKIKTADKDVIHDDNKLIEDKVV